MAHSFWHRLCKNTKRNQNKTNMTEKNEKINEELQQENVEAPVNEEATVEAEASANDTEKAEAEADVEVEVDPLEEAQARIKELETQLLYKQAEFDNYRKRTLKEKADLILNGGEKTIIAFLPVLDDFERAIASAEKTDDVSAIKDGMDLIFKKFLKTLEQQGVKKMETADADFNTDLHEAVAMVPGMGDDKKGKVIDCVQTGYTLNDKVIRHAKVAVGQ